jgi:putative ABC transport system permease protein
MFALFSLIIAAFGLFGLTLFIARTRTKEIGIRKTFGSRERTIIYSFLRGNLLLVTLASVISIPLTLYFMNKWLMSFAYKVKINWWVFGVAYILGAFVVLVTVFFQSYRASRINPVKSLRYE